MSAQLAIAQPRRIKATHRRRRKVTAGHFVQRYYDPQVGRFLSVDPVTTDATTGAGFSRYKYAANNPYRFTDPDGRQERAAEKWGEAAAKMTSAEKEPFVKPSIAVATAALPVAPVVRGLIAVVKLLESNKSDARPNGVPKDWVADTPAKGPGTIYRNPENPKHDTVRTVPGRPESSQPGQQADHIVRTANGARYGEANTPVPTRSAESHVSPEKFKFVPADKLPKP